MPRTILHFSSEDLHHARLSRRQANSLRDLLAHGAAMFGYGAQSAHVIKRLRELPPELLDTPLHQLTAEHLQALQRASTPTLAAFATSEGLQVLMLGMDRAYQLGLIGRAPDWLAPLSARLQSLRSRRFMDAFFGQLDAREGAIRRARDVQNACLAAAGAPLRPDLHGVTYVDDVKPLLLLLCLNEIQWHEWPALEWSDIDLAGGVTRVRSTGADRRLALDNTAKDALQKWYLQCPASRLVFPPRDGQTQAQHAAAILHVAKHLAGCARRAS